MACPCSVVDITLASGARNPSSNLGRGAQVAGNRSGFNESVPTPHVINKNWTEGRLFKPFGRKRWSRWRLASLLHKVGPIRMGNSCTSNPDGVSTLLHDLQCVCGVPHTSGGNQREVLCKCFSKPRCVGLFTACLLYTSPSPRDGLLSRMPSSA